MYCSQVLYKYSGSPEDESCNFSLSSTMSRHVQDVLKRLAIDDCHEIWCKYSWSPGDESYNCIDSLTLQQHQSFYLSSYLYCHIQEHADIQGSQMINPVDFSFLLNVVLIEMSRQQFNGLPWNFLQIVMVPRGWIVQFQWYPESALAPQF